MTTPYLFNARRIAEAVALVMGGATADQIMADQRGTPRVAELRAASMRLWRRQEAWASVPSFTATGLAFRRDRRSVARALSRYPSLTFDTLNAINAALRGL